MDFAFAPYVVTEVFLIVYAVAILYNLNASLGSENEIRELRRIVWAFFVTLATDIFWALVEDNIIVPNTLLNAAVNGVSISAVTCGCYFWYRFVTYRLSPNVLDNRRTSRLSALPLAVAVTLNLASIFTKWVFYIDAGGHYTYGPLFPVQATVCYFYLVIPTARSVWRLLRARSWSQRKEYLLYASYMIPPLVVGLIEDYVRTIPILYLSMFMVIHMLFLSIQDRQIYNDALTGLNNRRKLDVYLETSLLDASEKHPVLVVMMDVNRFKQINDTYGHIEGDRALRCAGTALQRTAARYGAFAARYGGDEFCLVYVGDEYTGEEITSRLHAALTQAQSEELPDKPYTLSMSMGWLVCSVPPRHTRERYPKRTGNSRRAGAACSFAVSDFIFGKIRMFRAGCARRPCR